MLKSTHTPFNSKFLQRILSTPLFLFSSYKLEFHYFCLLYHCLSMASSRLMTPCVEYLADRIANSSPKYYYWPA